MSDIYYAHPIDDTRYVQTDLAGWGTQVRKIAQFHGLTLFDPEAYWRNKLALPTEICEGNNRELEACGGLLALALRGIPSVGTPLEVQAALDWNKPVALVGGSRSTVYRYLAATNQGRLMIFPSDFAGLDQAVQWLKDQVAGRVTGISQADMTMQFPEFERGCEIEEAKKLLWAGDLKAEPQRFYAGDAGYDLVVAESVTIEPGEFKDVPCGLNVELPEGSWALIIGRSSTLRKHGLMVAPGIIDNGYRGPLFAGVYNLNKMPYVSVPGERLAQLILMPITAPELERIEWVRQSDRNTSGFGSTGS